MGDEIVLRCAMAKAFLYRCRECNRLLGEYGSAQEVLDNMESVDMEKVRPLLEEAFSGENLAWAREEVQWCGEKGVELLFYGEPGYPKLLMEVDNAPSMLYYKGTADLNAPLSISMVGTRLASAYGKEMCAMVISHLRDYNPLVVSGLAYGIDIAAHTAALEAGLNTVAVLPNGMDMIYPSRHRGIAAKMVMQGGILTEFPRGEQPVKMNFIKRNRIIAAISQGLIVVESRVKGGSMITAEYACSYDRDIFAVPGRVTDPNSFGCNYLIAKNVAAIYNSPATVPASLGWEGHYTPDSSFQPQLFSYEVGNKEKILLSLKSDIPMRVEQLCSATSMDWDTVSMLLLELELEGKISVRNNTDYYLRK